MEEVCLTEAESRYYNDLFLCCDVEKSGKISMIKATELFTSSNLPNDVIIEITSLAGIPATALHISRAQFYSCLKLIAASQAAMPLRQELIAATVQLALPRFNWKESPSGGDSLKSAINSLHNQANGLNTIAPPPPPAERRNSLPRRLDWQDGITTGSRRNSSSHQQQLRQDVTINSDVQSTDSEVEQHDMSCGGSGKGTGSSSRETNRRHGSPEAWSTNSDSPTPTNSVAERPWAKDTLWHGLLGDEHRQLLGTEEESSDRHSSDDDNETDLEAVYQITPEQREYYYKQFKAVQHDPNGLLSGHIARVFFEKSRIPVEELRHIWQLCDVTRDGALSLAEFTAAMHLVVLRRNNIPLPSVLPACLHPNMLQHSTLASQLTQKEPPEADLLHLDDDDDEDNTDNTVIRASSATKRESNVLKLNTPANSKSNIMSVTKPSSTSGKQPNLTPPSLPPPVKSRSISNSPNSPPNLPTILPIKPKDRSLWDVPPNQWTKFAESPISNVSSPGPKPANFDMQRTAQAVVSDPQILHPVPLRVTPVAGAATSSSGDNQSYEGFENSSQRDTSPKQCSLGNSNNVTNSGSGGAYSSHHRDSLQNNDLRAIQRPQAKKLPTKNIGALPPPPQREFIGGQSSGIGCSGDGELVMNNSSTISATSATSKKEPPPLPPPRPHRHARSSSLDLNKFKLNSSGGATAEITAQTSFDMQTSTGFADFTQFPDGVFKIDILDGDQQHSLPPVPAASQQSSVLPLTRFSLQSNQRVSAFEVYRKPNTPRNSQSPTPLVNHQIQTLQSEVDGTHVHHQPQPTQPPPPAPFGSTGATIMSHHPIHTTAVGASVNSALPNADVYEKRVNAISETLRHVSFRPDNNMTDILRHLREQNNLLLRLCNDLSDELLTVQTRKEEIRLKLEVSVTELNNLIVASNNPGPANASVGAQQLTRTGSSISAPVTANITGGSGNSSVYSNV